MTSTVLYCYTDKERPETHKALKLINKKGQDVIFSKMRHEYSYYWALFSAWFYCGWTERDLIVIEHDVEVTQDLIDTVERCTERWCGHTMNMGTDGYTTALGFMKFSKSLILQYPECMKEVGEMEDEWIPKTDWHRLDVYINQYLTDHGETIHAHSPSIHHYSEAHRIDV